MKKIRTQELLPGMKFTSPVYLDRNNILVPAKVAIKKKDIERLIAWNILELETEGELIPSVESVTDSDVDKLEKDIRELAIQNGHFREKSLNGFEPVQDPDAEHKNPSELLRDKYDGWIGMLINLHDRFARRMPVKYEMVQPVIKEIREEVRINKNELIRLMRSYTKGSYLASHCVNVAILSGIVGQSMGFLEDTLEQLITGCFFIDAGMIQLSEKITKKSGKLSEEELRKIRTHPLLGYQLLVHRNHFPVEVGQVALEHHEKMNGKGYPRGLTGDAISIFGRIAAVLDTYEAMTRHRTYRDEYISYEAMKNLLAGGVEDFDQRILRTFLKQIGVYPIGSLVKLNNSAIGRVVDCDPALPLRPSVKILFDEFGDRIQSGEVVFLSKQKDLFIRKAVNEKELE